jgi:hypothetical protein
LTEGLIRLSCGVEDTGDLLADLEQAFEGMPGNAKRDAARTRDTTKVGRT